MLCGPGLDPIEVPCHRVAVVVIANKGIRIRVDISRAGRCKLLDVGLDFGEYGQVETSTVVTDNVVRVLEHIVDSVNLRLSEIPVRVRPHKHSAKFFVSSGIVCNGTETK